MTSASPTKPTGCSIRRVGVLDRGQTNTAHELYEQTLRLNSAGVRALDVLSLEEQSLRADLPREKYETIHAILHFEKFTLVELPR